MHLKFPSRRDHIIRAVAFEKEISAEPKFPVVIRIVNERRLRENAFKPEVISEKPNQSSAGRHDRIGVYRTTRANHAEDFVFLERKTDEHFPGHVDRIAGDVVLEIRSGIDLDTCSGMIDVTLMREAASFSKRGSAPQSNQSAG